MLLTKATCFVRLQFIAVELYEANLTAWAEKTGIDRATMVRNAKVLSAKGVIRLAEGSRRDYCLSPSGEAVLEEGAALWDEAQADIEHILGKDGASFLLRTDLDRHREPHRQGRKVERGK